MAKKAEIPQTSQKSKRRLLKFVNPEDNTRENRDVAKLAEERASSEVSEDLNQVIADFGFNPAEFHIR